jgi:hypothetical protein
VRDAVESAAGTGTQRRSLLFPGIRSCHLCMHARSCAYDHAALSNVSISQRPADVSPCRCRPNNCFLGGARCEQRERTGGESGRSHRLYFAPRLLVVPSMLHRPSTMVPYRRARTALSMPPVWPVILVRLLVMRLLTQVAPVRLLIMRPLTRL